ncbi:EVE domain-containing protein [Cytophagaceae bacterium YF14B1]|uniref:UPF0310 protein QNI16_11915 n=1 Tax=Xanthocytophaga flava TaxID=3048013 RepID=A0AAE3QQV0_9BACT|nr:EVE domain-containing protein [Xanthocytophaga flavus]MDJ1481194.1 EVE domain-containing protein [Xanthocytophaga flavus]
MKQRYFIAVVSKEHTQRGVNGGFMQVCHGKKEPLKRMSLNDWLIVYSPAEKMKGSAKCMAFTAIGQASDDLVYAHKMSEDFIPFRRNITFYSCQQTSILPLIDQLNFIQNKVQWGYPFRFGFLEIQEHDFRLIASQMLEESDSKDFVNY